MNSHFVTTNKEELKKLFDQSHPEIKALIKGGELKTITSTLGEMYKIPVANLIPLSNIIVYVLIGALAPENVVASVVELVEVDEKTATLIATSLEKDIFQKARQITLGSTDEVVKLEYKGERTPDELRKEIMDTTKRDSALTTPQSSGQPPKKPAINPAGSRSALLEQLQILGNIPNDKEIEKRLKTIQEQISQIKKQEEADNTLESNIALKSFMFGEKGKEVVLPKAKTATYSVAPTQYNVDPYRETAED